MSEHSLRVEEFKKQLKVPTSDVVRTITEAVTAWLDTGALDDGKLQFNEILNLVLYLIPVLQKIVH